MVITLLAACGQPDNYYEIQVPPQATPTIFVAPPNVTVEAPNVTVTATVVLGCDANPAVCGQGTECVADMCLPDAVVNPPAECATLPLIVGVPITGQMYQPGDTLQMELVLLAPCGRLQITRLRPWVEGTPIGLTMARAFTSSSAGQEVASGAFWDDGINSFADLAFNPPLTVERGARLKVSIWIQTTTDLAPGAYIGGISEYELSDGSVNQGIETLGGRFEWVVVGEEDNPADEPVNQLLMISRDYRAPYATLYPTGTMGATISAYNFYALGKDVEISQIRFTQRETDLNFAYYRDCELLYLEDDGGNVLGSVIPVDNSPVINLFVPLIAETTHSAGTTVYLKANLLAQFCNFCTDPENGHAIGFDIAARSDIVARLDDGTTAYRSFWLDPPMGPTHYLYKGVPSFSREPISSGRLYEGENDTLTFTVSAIGSDIELAKTTFDIQAYGITVSNVRLYDVTDASEELVFEQTVNINSQQNVAAIFTRTVVISENTPRRFALRATVAGANSGDAMVVRMYGDAAPVSALAGRNSLPGTFSEIEADPENDFIWSDRSNPRHSATTRDWQNGYLVRGLASQASAPQVLSL